MQPPGEPREHHLGEVRQKSSSYTKFHKIFIREDTKHKCFFSCRTTKRGGGKKPTEPIRKELRDEKGRTKV